MHSEEFEQLLRLIGRGPPSDNEAGLEVRKDAEQQAQGAAIVDQLEPPSAKDASKSDAQRKQRAMVPLRDQWSLSMKGLVDVVFTTAENQGAEQGLAPALKLQFSTQIDKVHKKVKTLVPSPLPIK